MWSGSGTSNTLTNAPITVSGNNTTFAGTVYIPSKLEHTGDTDTFLNFSDDTITLSAGGSSTTFAGSGNATFPANVIAPNVFTQNIYITSSGTNSTNRIDNDGTQLYLTYGGTSSRALEILNSNGNATFAGRVMADTHFQSSDANATLSATGTGNIYLRPNGYSTTTGQVHINTSGNATFAGDVTIPQYLKHANDADTYFGFSASNQVLFHVGGSDRLIINSAGNVGIGTTSPSEKLVVQDGKVLAGHTNTRGYGFHDLSNYTYTANTGRLSLVSNGTEAVSIDSEQRVGIGITNPAGLLHIKGDTNSNGAEIYLQVDNNNTTDNLGAIHFGNNVDATLSEISSGTSGANNSSYIRFATSNTGAQAEKMRISATGNVGIGTTSPVYKLDVNGGVQAGGKVTYTKSAGSLNTTGYAVAGITADANGNGSSCGFTFTCFGHTGGYQKIVYSCYNGAGTWYAKKVINEGTNQLNVVASANGSTITFTFKAISSTMYYTPRVTVEATGHNINSTYA